MSTAQSDSLKRAVAILSEHFDASQVFVSYQTRDDRTIYAIAGSGNIYARHGIVRAWVKDMDIDEECIRAQALIRAEIDAEMEDLDDDEQQGEKNGIPR